MDPGKLAPSRGGGCGGKRKTWQGFGGGPRRPEQPVVKRILEDEELRGGLLAAYLPRAALTGGCSNGKPATKALFEDRKLQREYRRGGGRPARRRRPRSKSPPSVKRRRGGFGRTLMLALAAGVLAMALSESLRSKVLDLMFGAEEEFDYSSTTMPAQEAPTSVGAPAS